MVTVVAELASGNGPIGGVRSDGGGTLVTERARSNAADTCGGV